MKSAALAVLAVAASLGTTLASLTTNRRMEQLDSLLTPPYESPCLVAKADPACSAAQKSLGFPSVLHNRRDVRMLLVDEDSAPELAAFLNLTSCTDMAFVEASWADQAAPSVHVEHLLPDTKEELQSLVLNLIGVDAALCNNLPIAVKVFWVDHNDREVPNMRLAAGQCMNQRTYKGHRFLFRGEKMGNALGLVTVGQDATLYPTVPEDNESAAAAVADNTSSSSSCAFPPQGFPEDVREQEYIKARHAKCNERRLKLNEEKPGLVPHFTPVGFTKTKVPPALFAEILSFYHHNLPKEVNEGRSPDDCHHENDRGGRTTMVHASHVLRKLIFKAYQPLLEEWIGGEIPLEPTSMYGIRRYPAGSRLLKHGDTISTHAVSAIVNVDQEGITEEWPLQIHDHEGREHSVLLQPGEAVYYESVSCIHGREVPLVNGTYANLFVHFRPTIGWNYSYHK